MINLNKKQDDLVKSNISNMYSDSNRIEKSHSFPIGTIHNGFKKVGEGVWKKVSDYDMTRKEHESESILHKEMKKQIRVPGKDKSEMGVSNPQWHEDKANEHKKLANKLDDKDYSDEEVRTEHEKIWNVGPLEEPKGDSVTGKMKNIWDPEKTIMEETGGMINGVLKRKLFI